jgi:hypothetical protein
MIDDKACRVQILINQAGYPTHGRKIFVVDANIKLAPGFCLVDKGSTANWPLVFRGKLAEFNGDFGHYYVGDFSEFTVPGEYSVFLVQDPPSRRYGSYVFTIADNIYTKAVEMGLAYMAVQRCGPSTTGYNAPCHLDDGVRADNGEFVDLVGGWHDANDLFKSYGHLRPVIELLQIAATTTDKRLKARIFEEVRWGNLYFLKLQDKDGFVRNFGIAESRWTDNIRGTGDERKITAAYGVTAYTPLSLQYWFITAQADLYRVFKDDDADYAQKCLQAAQKCFARVRKEHMRDNCVDLSNGAAAGAALFEATENSECLDYAVKMADGLLALQQQPENEQTLAGFFYEDARRLCGVENAGRMQENLIPFCRFIESLRGRIDTARWEQALRLYCDRYLARVAARNAFGITPCQAKVEERVRGVSRDFQGCSYRYFRPWHLADDGFSAGVRNGNTGILAGNGLVFCSAARILGVPEYRALAQRQLDWILGANPFGVSFMRGVGHVDPPEYWVDQTFRPRTPTIPGSVVLGVASDAEDRPDLLAGTWQSCEITIGFSVDTIWLMHELMRKDSK